MFTALFNVYVHIQFSNETNLIQINYLKITQQKKIYKNI